MLPTWRWKNSGSAARIIVRCISLAAIPALPFPICSSILRITKQSLARVLGALMDQGYVAQSPGSTDRRQRLLTLSAAGAALERRLFERQQERLRPAYREAGPAAVDGFRRVLHGIMDDTARAYIDAHHARED